MSDAELNTIEKRCEAARRGPWKSCIEGRDHVAGSNIIAVGQLSDGLQDIDIMGATPDDQDFIAAARTDIPALIAEIRRLRSRLELK